MKNYKILEQFVQMIVFKILHLFFRFNKIKCDTNVNIVRKFFVIYISRHNLRKILFIIIVSTNENCVK